MDGCRGHLKHYSFVAMRADKNPEVVRDVNIISIDRCRSNQTSQILGPPILREKENRPPGRLSGSPKH